MKTDGRTRVCAVIADPVEHSMSPLLQNLYAERTGINMQYVPLRVEDGNLCAAIKGAFALNILGLNVTVPHKQRVIKYLTEIDGTAEAIGAVNTLVRTATGYKGYNTDVPGLLRAVTEAGITIKGRECILIGAGGAAKAAAYMMGREGASVIYLLNRSRDRAVELSEYVNGLFGRELVRPMELSEYREIPGGQYFAVQSTSVGMYPGTDAAPIEDPEFYKNISEAVEIIYTPAETRFMRLVQAAGGHVVNGLNMLLYQGVIAYELWNPGVRVSEDTIEEARQMIVHKLAAALKKSRFKRAGKNLILIGFMGAGKTSVGTHYAGKHGIPMVDTDQLIEITSGMSVSQIFASQGEEAFRQRETQMIKNLLDMQGSEGRKTLISVGGGLPLRPENRELLKELGTVIYLRVKPETVMERLKGDKARPLLSGDNVKQRVEELMALRDPLYIEASHVVLDADDKDFEQLVCELEEL